MNAVNRERFLINFPSISFNLDICEVYADERGKKARSVIFAFLLTQLTIFVNGINWYEIDIANINWKRHLIALHNKWNVYGLKLKWYAYL